MTAASPSPSDGSFAARLLDRATLSPVPALAAALLAVTLVVGIVIVDLYRVFVVAGPYLHDIGMYMGLMGTLDPRLPHPPSFSMAHSYYDTHLSPLFHLLGLVRAGLGVSTQTFTYWVFVLVYAPTALTPLALAALHPETRSRRALVLVAAPVTVLFATSGVLKPFFTFPHPETVFGALAPLGLVLVTTGRAWTGAAALACLFLLREDMGFHLFGFAFLAWAWLGFAGGDPETRRRLGRVAVFAFAASLVALVIQKIGFTADDGLKRIYLGDPPFAHLSLAYVRANLVEIALESPWLPLLLVACAIMARRARDPGHLIGILAVGPWVALSVVAHAPAARALTIYYAFPLLMTAVWPLVWSVHVARDRDLGRPVTALLLLGAVALVGSSAVHRAELRLRLAEEAFGATGTRLVTQIRAIEPLLAELVRTTPDRVLVSASVAGATAGRVPGRRVLIAPYGDKLARSDAVIFFWVEDATFEPFKEHFGVLSPARPLLRWGETQILISCPDEACAADMSGRAEAVGVPLVRAEAPLAFLMRTPPAVDVGSNGFRTRRPIDGTLAYGPYMTLSPGRWRVTATVETTSCATAACLFTVTVPHLGAVEHPVTPDHPLDVVHDFVVDAATPERIHQTVFSATGGWHGRILRPTLVRLGD